MAQFESSDSSTGSGWGRAEGRRGELDVMQTAARLLFVVLAAALAFYFASKGVSLARNYERIIATAYEAEGPPKFPESGDITVFYTAGKVIVSNERSGLYDSGYFIPEVFETQGWQRDDPLAGDGAWSKYYNPPFFALLLSPLSLFDVHTAYAIVLGINIAAALLLVYLMARILHWRQPATLLLFLALFSFTPVYFVFQHAQPSLLLALVLAGGYLLLRSGAHRASALLLVFGGLKPQWLALPALVVAQSNRRALLWSATGAVLVILLPFALVGVKGLSDYIGITLDRGGGDLSDQDFSAAILSWSGFVRALTGSPQPLLWLMLAATTLGAFVLVWFHGDQQLSAGAAILTTLLVVPHSHPQDWVVVLVVAAIALSRNAPLLSHLAVGGLLLGVYFAANDWPNASYAVSKGDTAVYWITLGGAGLVFLFAALPHLEARIAAAPSPSLLRFEWEAPGLALVRPWHLAGAAFSLGMVLGLASALALVRQGEPGPVFSSSGRAQIVANGDLAKARAGWSITTGLPARLFQGPGPQPPARALATALPGPEVPGANAAAEAAPAPAGVDLVTSSVRAPGEATPAERVSETQAAVSEVSSVNSGPDGILRAPGAPAAGSADESTDGMLSVGGSSPADAAWSAHIQEPSTFDLRTASALGDGADAGPSAAAARVRAGAVLPLAASQSTVAAGFAAHASSIVAAVGSSDLTPPVAILGESLSTAFRVALASKIDVDVAQRSLTGAAGGAGDGSSGGSLPPAPEGGATAEALGSAAPEHPAAARVEAMSARAAAVGARLPAVGALVADHVSFSMPQGLQAPAVDAGRLAGASARVTDSGESERLLAFNAWARGQRAEVSAIGGGLLRGVAGVGARSLALLATQRVGVGDLPLTAGRLSRRAVSDSGRGALPPLGAVLTGLGRLDAMGDFVSSARAAAREWEASTRAAALAAAATPTPVPTVVADRHDCEAIRTTGARTPGEEDFLRTSCEPTPEPVVAAPPTPVPARPQAPPPAAGCSRVSVVAAPSVVAMADGGLRIEAELASSEPAGCTQWPSAFSATATIVIPGGSRQGTWSCESGRNPTAGVPASTHFVFFCNIGQRTSATGGSSSITIQVTALSADGAVLATSSQSFTAPNLP